MIRALGYRIRMGDLKPSSRNDCEFEKLRRLINLNRKKEVELGNLSLFLSITQSFSVESSVIMPEVGKNKQRLIEIRRSDK